MKNKSLFIDALLNEIFIRRNYVKGEVIDTIYLGGGTPSLLNKGEIDKIFKQLHKYYNVISHPEVTLEANPDDLSPFKLKELRHTQINRLSIGIQSFFDKDLKYLNRVHSGKQAYESIMNTKEIGFNNISIDLIYGIPTLSAQNWVSNLKKFISLGLNHLSAYALTVEPKTPLKMLIERGDKLMVKEQKIISHYNKLVSLMNSEGYEHYEISNFCKRPYYSKHNMSYWSGKKYLGFGPSAHSFNGSSRQWNISKVSEYIKEVFRDKMPFEIEYLTTNQKYNEYILTSLRTIWGVDVSYIEEQFGSEMSNYFLSKVKTFIASKKINTSNQTYTLTNNGKLFADGIAAQLFR